MSAMTKSYTRKNLADVEDSAPKFGLDEVQQARFANEDLKAESRPQLSHGEGGQALGLRRTGTTPPRRSTWCCPAPAA